MGVEHDREGERLPRENDGPHEGGGVSGGWAESVFRRLPALVGFSRCRMYR